MKTEQIEQTEQILLIGALVAIFARRIRARHSRFRGVSSANSARHKMMTSLLRKKGQLPKTAKISGINK